MFYQWCQALFNLVRTRVYTRQVEGAVYGIPYVFAFIAFRAVYRLFAQITYPGALLKHRA